jgi:hypothetical protein
VQRVVEVRRANALPTADMIALRNRLHAMADMLEQGVPPRAVIRRYAAVV